MGLSLLCVLAGMAVATLPDAGEPEANFNYKVKRHLRNDFQVEDPYVTVACLPLPFSMAPPGNGKVLSPKGSHQDHDKRTEFVEKIVVAPARAKRHVILVAPREWSPTAGPSDQEIYQMLDAGDLVAFDAGGPLGPSFLTTLVTLESALQGWCLRDGPWQDDRGLQERIRPSRRSRKPIPLGASVPENAEEAKERTGRRPDRAVQCAARLYPSWRRGTGCPPTTSPTGPWLS